MTRRARACDPADVAARARMPPLRRFWPGARRGLRVRGIRRRAPRGERVAHRARERAAARALPLRRRRRRAPLRALARGVPLPRAARRPRRRAAAARHDARRARAPADPARARRPRRARGAGRSSARSSTTSTSCRTCRCGSCSRSSRRRPSRSASVVFMAFVWWPAALTLLACLVAAGLAATLWGWAAGARAERDIAPLRARARGCRPRPPRQPRRADRLRRRGRRAASASARPTPRSAARSSAARWAQAGTAAVVSLLAGVGIDRGAAGHRAGRGTPGRLDGAAARRRRPRADGGVRGVRRRCRSPRRPGGRCASARRASRMRCPPNCPTELVAETRPADRDAPALGDGSAAARRVGALARRRRMPSLHDIDLDVRPGERVLVVGSSGAGKTTLAHALVRFLEIDGLVRRSAARSVHDLAGDDVRLTVGLCEQRPMLFDEDIRQNLLFANDTATDAELAGRARPRRPRRRGCARAAGSTRGSASAARSSRAVRRSASRSHARCCAASRCSCSTSRPRASTPRHPMPCSPTCCRRVGDDQAVVLISHVAVPAGMIDREVRLVDGRVVDA